MKSLSNAKGRRKIIMKSMEKKTVILSKEADYLRSLYQEWRIV